MPAKPAVVNEEIIRFPQAEPWMIGRPVEIIEEFPEDGEMWCVVEIGFEGVEPFLLRAPLRYFDKVEEEKVVPPVVEKSVKSKRTKTSAPTSDDPKEILRAKIAAAKAKSKTVSKTIKAQH